MNWSKLTDWFDRTMSRLIGISGQHGYETYRKSAILALICMAVLVLCAIITIVDVFQGQSRYVFLFLGFCVVMGFIFFLIRKGVRVIWLGNLLLAVCYPLVLFSMYERGGLLSAQVIFLVLIPAVSVLVTNTMSSVIWSAICVLTVFSFIYLHETGDLPQNQPDAAVYFSNALTNYVTAILFVSSLFIYSEASRRKARKLLLEEMERSDKLLLNILPEDVARELEEKGHAKARYFDQVTVIFTDFEDFTRTSSKLQPAELLAELELYFGTIDRIIEHHGIEKIKTIGDAYMAVGGLPIPSTNHAEKVVKAALEIRDAVEKLPGLMNGKKETVKRKFPIRIGIHTGPVVAGVVGFKKFQFDIWGDTVNTASRMESNGVAGKVNISETTYELVKDKFNCEYRGEVEVKGKGKVKMYFVERSEIP